MQVGGSLLERFASGSKSAVLKIAEDAIMRFVYYDDLDSGEASVLGIEVFGVIYDLHATISAVIAETGGHVAHIPKSVWEYHNLPAEHKIQLEVIVNHIDDLAPEMRAQLIRTNANRLAPVPGPRSVRCFSIFEGHTKAVRERRGLSMPTEWYREPGFFFGNHNAIYGHGEPIAQPASFWLDFELQIACVIGKAGINIRAEDAEAYIAGYTIMNDWCARDLEMYEMRLGSGIAKGRDFGISLGPTLVTPDELESFAIGEGDRRRFDLRAEASVNNRVLPGMGYSNIRAMQFSFAQMIERASQDAMLYPGDILGSGAVNGGSLLSLGAEETLGRWLQPGDIVDLEVQGLGVLRNAVAPPRL